MRNGWDLPLNFASQITYIKYAIPPSKIGGKGREQGHFRNTQFKEMQYSSVNLLFLTWICFLLVKFFFSINSDLYVDMYL